MEILGEINDSKIQMGTCIGQRNVSIADLMCENLTIDLGSESPKFTIGEATKSSTQRSFNS